MPKPTTLNERLREARADADLTQEELAQESGLSSSTVSKLERDPDCNPTRTTLEAYAKACGTTVDKLTSGLRVLSS